MDDWKMALDQAVRARWADGKVFFVAQVKPFLAKQNIDFESLLNGRQVRRFLESEMPELEQVQHDHEPTNWGLVPADANVETPTSKYFARSGTHQQSEFPYQNALKVAFTRALEPGKARWVSFNPARFVDLPAGEQAQASVELPADDITPGLANDRLVERVESFLKSCGLNPEALKIGQARVVQPPRGRTALHQLLALIPSGDLSRVSMPLDLVRRLLDQSDDAQR